MNGPRIAVLFLFLVGILATSNLAAAPLVLKVGSVAPEASPWGEALTRVALAWKQISGGQVELKIYHGGIAGGESDTIRKMRLGQLQGGVLTSFGLNEISPEFLSLSMPFVIHNDDELDYVLEKASDTLKAKIAAQKFHVAAFSKVGWIRFFSKKPLRVPADLKTLKLAANPGNQALFDTWQSMGYNQVPVEIPNTLTALNSGRIEALYASPIAVGGFQWFGLAKYMMSLRMAPFLGGVILTQAAWDKIPESLRPQLEDAAKPILVQMDKDIKKMEVDAIATMKTYGMVQIDVTPAEESLWKAEMDAGLSKMIGKSFSKEIYDLMLASLAEFRKK